MIRLTVLKKIKKIIRKQIAVTMADCLVLLPLYFCSLV